MPASLVMKKFAAGKLRSGNKKTGPVVTNPHQAKAILLSEARSEGYKIPKPEPSWEIRNLKGRKK